jgi:hypothetical protein
MLFWVAARERQDGDRDHAEGALTVLVRDPPRCRGCVIRLKS